MWTWGCCVLLLTNTKLHLTFFVFYGKKKKWSRRKKECTGGDQRKRERWGEEEEREGWRIPNARNMQPYKEKDGFPNTNEKRHFFRINDTFILHLWKSLSHYLSYSKLYSGFHPNTFNPKWNIFNHWISDVVTLLVCKVQCMSWLKWKINSLYSLFSFRVTFAEMTLGHETL